MVARTPVRRIWLLACVLVSLTPACQPGIEATPDALPADAPLAPDPVARPQHVRYRGQLAASPAVAFGGDGYCSYRVTLRNVEFDLVLRDVDELASMTIADTMVETIVGSCPYSAQPTSQQGFVHGGSPVAPGADGAFRPLLIGLATNQPMVEATATVTPRGDGSLEVTARWVRTDQPPPLEWIVTTAQPVLLQPQACEAGALVCLGGSLEGVLYTCADGLQMEPVKRCIAGCAPSELACN